MNLDNGLGNTGLVDQALTVSNLTMAGLEHTMSQIEEATNMLERLAPLFVLVVGIPGNILTIYILQKPSMMDNFLSVLLTGLAVADLYVLLDLVEDLLMAWWGIALYPDIFLTCFLSLYKRYSGVAYVNWHVVVVAICRVVFLMDPHRVPKQYSPKHAVNIILALFTVNAVSQFIFLRAIVYHTSGLNNARDLSCSMRIGTFLHIAHALTWALGPGLCLIAINWAMVNIHNSHRKRMQEQFRNNTSSHRRNTLTLLILVSDLQVTVTLLPLSVYHVTASHLFDLTDHVTSARASLIGRILRHIYYLGTASNFIVYCCFGSRFRQEMWRTLRACCTGVGGRSPSASTDSRATATAGRTLTQDSIILTPTVQNFQTANDEETASPSLLHESPSENSPEQSLRPFSLGQPYDTAV